MKSSWIKVLSGSLLASVLVLNASVAQSLPDWSELFEKNKSSVVSITVKGKEEVRGVQGMPFFDEGDPFQFFFGDPRQRQPQKPRERVIQGGGSGFIVEKDGIIVTNALVVG